MNGRNFSIALELLRLREQLSTITAPTVATITPASATEGILLYLTLLEQPFCSRYFVYFYIHQWNGWSADYTTTNVTVTVPAGATTGTVSVPNCGYN
jgi:hypothetical protein